MSALKDMTGMVIGRLKVRNRADGQHRKAHWNCVCECGAHVVVMGEYLRNGTTKSCGCYRSEKASVDATARNFRHGHNRSGTGNQSPTWNSWSSMRKRCTLKSHRSYPDYGGRGIIVCERWTKFEAFLADMGERPEGKTLDRIDVNGNYEPSNCQWATLSEQQKNKRSRKCSS